MQLLINTGGWVGLSESGVLEDVESSACLALRWSDSGFQTLKPSPIGWKFEGKWEYLCLVERLHQCSSKDPPQWNSKSTRSDNVCSPVSTSCAPTLESTSSRISIDRGWLEVIGTRARWLFKQSCLWKNKLEAARGTPWESIVIS